MDNNSKQGEAWVQLIREVIASWPLVLRVMVLMLACTPAVIMTVLVLFIAR